MRSESHCREPVWCLPFSRAIHLKPLFLHTNNQLCEGSMAHTSGFGEKYHLVLLYSDLWMKLSIS